MVYRTKTYIAGDWDGDKSAIDQLCKWNDGDKWGLSFNNAHDLLQANDESLNCSIKASLAQRFDVSKTFVLIVGDGTKTRRAGECNYCIKYKNNKCESGNTISNKSYIEYECNKAVRDGLNIIVLYNSTEVDKTKCPDAVKNIGTHAHMQVRKDRVLYWDYYSVKKAFGIK